MASDKAKENSRFPSEFVPVLLPSEVSVFPKFGICSFHVHHFGMTFVRGVTHLAQSRRHFVVFNVEHLSGHLFVGKYPLPFL